MANLITSQSLVGLQPIIDYSVPGAPTNYSLPTGSNIVAGQRVRVVNGAAVTTTNNILVNGSDGTLVRTVYPGTDAEFVALQANPTNQSHWAAFGQVTSNIVSYAPLLTGATTNPTVGYSRQNGFWKRQGDVAEIQINFLTSTFTAGTGSLLATLPSGLSVDITKTQQSGNADAGVGSGLWYSSNAGQGLAIVPRVTSGQITALAFWRVGTGGELGQGTGAFIASDQLTAKFTVPIVGWSATRG